MTWLRLFAFAFAASTVLFLLDVCPGVVG